MKQTKIVEAIITLLRVCELINDDHHNAMIDELIRATDSLYNEMTDEDLMEMVDNFIDKKLEERETNFMYSWTQITRLPRKKKE